MKINDVTTYEIDGQIGVITIDAPPVNALSAQVRQGVLRALGRALEDENVEAIILMCAGRTFFSGADIKEFGKPPIEPTLRELGTVLENATKPVIAAMHGTALGGGLETALVCHYRVAVPTAHMGLPEVSLGLLPGAGGTQRLPRVVGVRRALEMICSGERVSAQKAFDMGLLDAVVEEGNLRAEAMAFAARILDEKRPLVRVREMNAKLNEARAHPTLFDDFRSKNARKFRGFKAPEACIRCIEAAVTLPFEEAMVFERKQFQALMEDSQSAAQRHIFFAERQAAKIADIDPAIETLPIAKVGIVGAGTMGGGIAMNFLNAGIPVTIIETGEASLQRGLDIIRKNYDLTASKGKMSLEDVDARMQMLTGSLTFDDLAQVDLIIEAVFENLEVKRDVFARLDRIAKPGAILATNASYLDIERIAAATARPESVIGLHFFSPANVMKLLEIVRTKKTAKPIVATAAKLAKIIGKTGVTVGNGFGFVGNRILAARGAQADQLLLEGATPEQVDLALYDFGFPMGHFQMRDLAGLDIGWNRDESASTNVREILNEMGRHGQKSGCGYYDYDNSRQSSPSSVVLRAIEDFSARQGITRRDIPQAEILDRILYAMVNEGADILNEGVASRASDIDVIWVMGYGWPRYRGGPMFWADLQGMSVVLDKLNALRVAHGDAFTPSALIERLAAQGKHFADR